MLQPKAIVLYNKVIWSSGNSGDILRREIELFCLFTILKVSYYQLVRLGYNVNNYTGINTVRELHTYKLLCNEALVTEENENFSGQRIYSNFSDKLS